MISRIKKALRTIRREGFSAGYSAFLRQIDKGRRDREYRDWAERYDTLDDAGRERLRSVAAELKEAPLISVLMPVYNVEERFLLEAIGSVRAQIYENWELCIADDASTEPHVRRVLEELAAKDARIRVTFRETNGHISAASNTALEMVRGEFTALMDHDDILAEDALLQAARVITSRPEVNLIYSDEDKIDANGVRFQPMFKPDWSPELMRSLNLITHLCVFRTEVLRAIGGFRTGFEGSQDYDLSLRFIDSISPETIVHIPHVLYHWRAIPGSVALDSSEKTYAHERARTALTEHYRRSGIAARAVRGRGELHRPEFLSEPPTVSVILWGEGTADIDLGRVHEVREAAGDVASILREANEASGDALVFLHRDADKLSRDFFTELAHRATVSGVGAVGPNLLDGDRRIANAGFVLGIMNGIGRPHFGMRRDALGPFVGLAADRNTLALSLAAMAVERKTFAEAGGLDDSFGDPVASGIDLCLRLHAAGKRNVWTPWAEATSANASNDVGEESIARLRARWQQYFDRDPYYNPNLTAEGEGLGFAEPPRISRNRRDNKTLKENLTTTENPRKVPAFVMPLVTVLIGAADAALAGGALIAAFVIREGLPVLSETAWAWSQEFVPYAGVFWFAMVVRVALLAYEGVYRFKGAFSYSREAAKVVKAVAIGSLLIVAWAFLFRGGYAFREFSYSRAVFLLDFAFALAFFTAFHLLVRWAQARIRSRGVNLLPTLIVGTNAEAAGTIAELRDRLGLGYRVAGVVATDDSAEREFAGAPIVGSFAELPELIRRYGIQEVIITEPAIGSERLFDSMMEVGRDHRVEFRFAPKLFDLLPQKTAVEQIGVLPMVRLFREPLSDAGRLVKRVSDIIISLAAILVLSPVIAFVALAVRRSSSGPIFFRQERVGMDGRVFLCLKFRTMFADSDEDIHREAYRKNISGEAAGEGEIYGKVANDPRITPAGRWIRRWSLDELPQLFNVLRGEMSIVGPRPPIPYEVEEYDIRHRKRLDMKPGITGLWQVSGRNRLTFEEMVGLDIFYIENWSVWLDLKIIFLTLPAIFRGDGERTER